jgi:hypothetical protein
MFNPDVIIDSVQSYKKAAVNHLIKDNDLNTAAHAYIDTQTEFVKKLTKHSMNTMFSFVNYRKQEPSAAPYKI